MCVWEKNTKRTKRIHKKESNEKPKTHRHTHITHTIRVFSCLVLCDMAFGLILVLALVLSLSLSLVMVRYTKLCFLLYAEFLSLVFFKSSSTSVPWCLVFFTKIISNLSMCKRSSELNFWKKRKEKQTTVKKETIDCIKWKVFAILFFIIFIFISWNEALELRAWLLVWYLFLLMLLHFSSVFFLFKMVSGTHRTPYTSRIHTVQSSAHDPYRTLVHRCRMFPNS